MNKNNANININISCQKIYSYIRCSKCQKLIFSKENEKILGLSVKCPHKGCGAYTLVSFCPFCETKALYSDSRINYKVWEEDYNAKNALLLRAYRDDLPKDYINVIKAEIATAIIAPKYGIILNNPIVNPRRAAYLTPIIFIAIVVN